MTECPPFFLTLPADFISKKNWTHDGMPAKFLERKKHDGMPANFITLPAHSIPTDIEKHDGMVAIFLERFFSCVFFVGISFPGASRAALEDQVGSQVDLVMVLRIAFRKWTSPLCENPIIYYVFEVAFCENPITYYVSSCPGDVFWRPCGLFGHPWAHFFLTLASSKKTQNFRLPLERSKRDIW